MDIPTEFKYVLHSANKTLTTLLAEIGLIRQNLQQQTKSQADAEQRKQDERISGLPTRVQFVEGIEVRKAATDKKDDGDYQKGSLRVQRLTLYAVVIYAAVAYLQWFELNTANINQSAATIGASASGSSALFFAKKQTDALQEQVKAAQQNVDIIGLQFREDQRAKIAVLSRGIRFDESEPILNLIEIANTGKTPALHVRLLAVIEKVKNGHSPKFSYASPAVNFMNVGVLGADPETFPVTMYNPATPQIRPEPVLFMTIKPDLMSGEYYVATYVIARYEDVFGGQHWTKYCAWNNSLYTGGVSAIKCADYNTVDTVKIPPHH